MSSGSAVHLDVLILGGGAAGLWLLESLQRVGYEAAVIEKSALGSGQTIASQGIIHSGLKYTLSGMLTSSAKAIRDMPGVWRDCLAGARQPDLSLVRLRAPTCYLWQTTTLASRLGMLGARSGLRVRPVPVEDDQRPPALRKCPGVVARLDEQVIEPGSCLSALAAHVRGRVILSRSECDIRRRGDGCDVLIDSGSSRCRLRCRWLVLAAGEGNEAIRRSLGLPNGRSQRRPLHMTVVRGESDRLPELCGHCVDGRKTRVTVTSTTDHVGRSIWQLGGQIAEDGVALDSVPLVHLARDELASVLPGVDLRGLEWSTYRVDRAEARMRRVVRPDDAQVLVEGRILTTWPTKLALVPRLADRVQNELDAPAGYASAFEELSSLPDPPVAKPPWEEEAEWIRVP